MACSKEEQGDKKGRSLAEDSCHRYASNGNSSKNTRAIANVAAARSVPRKGRKGKNQRYRENRKRAKILALDSPQLEDWEEAINAVTVLGRKVYFGGISERLLPTHLPAGSIRWSVHRHLIPYLNEHGGGCRAGNYYTLLPRDWIIECFPKTQQFFLFFMKLLELHPGLMPRGENKQPVFDRGTPETYVTVGTSAKRFGRGLRVVERRLKNDALYHDRSFLKKYFRQVAHAATAYLDTPSIRFLNVVKEMMDFAKFSFDGNDESLIWPSVAVAANVVMEMHTDQDYVMGCAGVIGGRGYRNHDPKGSDILQYFCFPSIGSAVGLRNGDLLLFNPTIPHCVSSRATMKEDVICTSFYLKTAIVGGNDNSQIVSANKGI
jgi:hypothetical protein